MPYHYVVARRGREMKEKEERNSGRGEEEREGERE